MFHQLWKTTIKNKLPSYTLIFSIISIQYGLTYFLKEFKGLKTFNYIYLINILRPYLKMEPKFISVFNSYKIYHISHEEYAQIRKEEERLTMQPGCFQRHLDMSLDRRFFLFKDQYFTYCKQSFASLVRMICANEDDTHCGWFHSRREPLNPSIAYVSNEYRRIISLEACHHHGRERIESIIIKIIISKYWDELQGVVAVKPVEIPVAIPEMPVLYSSSVSSKGPIKLKAVAINQDLPLIKRKKKSIPLALKRKVWNKYIGEDVGKALCLCCKLSYITQMSFSAGHIIAEADGGELKLDNLRPICGSCNSSMGTKNMDHFISEYGL